MLDLRDTVFLTGAGISVDAGVPAAMPLLDFLLNGLTAPASSRPEVQLAQKICTMSTPANRRVRFEVAVGWIVELYDPDDELFSFLDAFGTPARLHERLAAAALGGASVLTLNFDDLLEQSLRNLNATPYTVNPHVAIPQIPANGVPVYKLHGTRKKWRGESAVAGDASDVVIATAQRVSRLSPRLRLNETAMRWLTDVIDGKSLVVVGYSASDDLDIVPALTGTSPRACHWIEYAPKGVDDATAEWLANPDGTERRRLIQTMSERGTAVQVLEGWPHDAFTLLGMPPSRSAADPTDGPEWRALLRPWVDAARAREPTGLALPGFLLSEVLHTREAKSCFEGAQTGPGVERYAGWTRGRRMYELAQNEFFLSDAGGESAIELVQWAIDYSVEDGDDSLRIRAKHLLARILFSVDRDSEAAQILDEALVGATGADRASLLEWRGHVAAYLDGAAEALPYLDEAISCAESAGDTGVLADSLTFRGSLRLQSGSPVQGLDDACSAAVVSILPQPDRLFYARVLQGQCLFATDDLDGAEQTLVQALDDYADREHDSVEVFLAYQVLARIAAERGDFDRGHQIIQHACGLNRGGRYDKSVGPLMADLIAFELLCGNLEAARIARRQGTFLTQDASGAAFILGHVAGLIEDQLFWALEAPIIVDRVDELTYLASVIARVSNRDILLVPLMRKALAGAAALAHTRWHSLIAEWLVRR